MIRFYLFILGAFVLSIGAFSLHQVATRRYPARDVWRASIIAALGLGGLLVAVFWP